MKKSKRIKLLEEQTSLLRSIIDNNEEKIGLVILKMTMILSKVVDSAETQAFLIKTLGADSELQADRINQLIDAHNNQLEIIDLSFDNKPSKDIDNIIKEKDIYLDIDSILDKITLKGIESLTPEEKEFLDKNNK